MGHVYLWVKKRRHILAQEYSEKQGQGGDFTAVDRVECAFFAAAAKTLETNHIFQQIGDLKERVEMLRRYL